MRLEVISIIASLALLSACGAESPGEATDGGAAGSAAPATAGASPATGRFDWDKWAAVVNENPCDWFTADELAALGLPAEGEYMLTSKSKESICSWKAPDGSALLSASIYPVPGGPVNLIGQRQEAVRDIRENSGFFEQVGSGDGTVLAILRKDRPMVGILPYSDDESVTIQINGMWFVTDTTELKAEKRARVKTFTEALLKKYGL